MNPLTARTAAEACVNNCKSVLETEDYRKCVMACAIPTPVVTASQDKCGEYKRLQPKAYDQYIDDHENRAVSIINGLFVAPVNRDVAPSYNDTYASRVKSERLISNFYKDAHSALTAAATDALQESHPCAAEASGVYDEATYGLSTKKGRIVSELSTDPAEIMMEKLNTITGAMVLASGAVAGAFVGSTFTEGAAVGGIFGVGLAVTIAVVDSGVTALVNHKVSNVAANYLFCGRHRCKSHS